MSIGLICFLMDFKLLVVLATDVVSSINFGVVLCFV